MGQALRRVRPPPPAPSPPARPPPPPPPRASPAAAGGAPSNGDVTASTKNAHGVLEERDPSYEEMLKHMVGRITTKPGGKPEMGDASVVQRYDRPLPKVRTSKADPGQSGSRQLPSGALNVQHIQEIIQLYQGKSSAHHGPMSVDDIASKFRVEASIIRNIVQFVSLPQDETAKKKEEF
ncbi:pre-mRNA-splicing ATP-dependent RNA helicase PRP28 [Panicum miliaceum]|uniref:Pre-mRNA-splicing ATP-dependent RNA helicase PRP28 n=1 Tax=Panicum miliaceum TaxID=4540 RepID=A0A3L6SYJ9_PANMI|nr:pre-mRNA-splicing ATP-dependent RNA helicase PRP28 [Panicum miliaceum]